MIVNRVVDCQLDTRQDNYMIFGTYPNFLSYSYESGLIVNEKRISDALYNHILRWPMSDKRKTISLYNRMLHEHSTSHPL